MKQNLPQRKKNRLKDYDYSNSGYYFITICIKNKKQILGKINVGANCVRPKIECTNEISLSNIGKIINKEINKIENIYENVIINKYVIMPNHIHMIVVLRNSQIGRTQFAPTVSQIVKQFKGAISKQIGFSVWQKSYHDHIIRNELNYYKIWQYIDTNIKNWEKDCFY